MTADETKPAADENPFDDPALPELLAAALEAADEGREPDLDRICSDRPDLVPILRESLGTGRRLATLRKDSAASDRHVGLMFGGRFQLVQRLGSGAMGVVYLARDTELGRDVAVKLLRAVLLDGAEAERRFRREAEVLAAIDHAAVVKIFDRGRSGDDESYLVMELLRGASLHDVVEEARRANCSSGVVDLGAIQEALGDDAKLGSNWLRTVVGWTADLAAGLHAAHRAGVHHRDVKPSNVFIREDGTPVLVDFGIASLGGDGTITRDGQPLGTPAYTAPEALNVSNRPSPTLDVYGLASTLYHALALKPPYTGTPSQILAQLSVKEPPSLQSHRRELPRDLAAIVEKGMSRRPQDRYASAADFEDDLRAFLDHRPVRARPVPTIVRAVRRLRRSRSFVAASAALLVVALVMGGINLWDAYQSSLNRQRRDAYAPVPANLGMVGFVSREATTDEEFAAVSSALDESVLDASQTVPRRVVRAAWYLDHGDVDTARADMRRVADFVATPYARALADAYVALDDDASGIEQLDVSALPEPSTSDDLWLALFHAFRRLDYGTAMKIAGDERLERTPHAEQYLLLLRMSDTAEVLERAYAAEAAFGRRTASTAHLVGTALLFQNKYERALSVFDEALAYAPYSYVSIDNAGRCAWQLGMIERAEAYFQRAIEIRPTVLGPHANLVRMLMTNDRIDEATRLYERIPFGNEARHERERHRLAGEIHGYSALADWRSGEFASAVDHGSAGKVAFERAGAVGVKLDRIPIYAFCCALDEGSDELDEDTEKNVVTALLRSAAEDPTNRWMTETLIEVLSLDDVELPPSALVEYLHALREDLDERAFIDQKRIQARFPTPPISSARTQSGRSTVPSESLR